LSDVDQIPGSIEALMDLQVYNWSHSLLFSWRPRRDGNKILDPGKKLEPVLLLPSATEQTLPLTDVDICEDPKRLKREWETLTEVATV
jgi:hypothetical protein